VFEQPRDHADTPLDFHAQHRFAETDGCR